MSNKIWDDKSTDLTLNGPKVAISADTSANISLVAPNGQTGGGVTDQTSVTFSVTGVSTFPDGTNADGGLSYQWYEINDGALGISTRYAGAGTSTLTISHALSPEDNGNQYYNRITFTPDSVSAGGTSGDPINSFVETTPVSLSVAPELFISAGVTTSTVAINQEATFSCRGGINRDKVSTYDDNQENSIAYQWYLDGSSVSNGNVQKVTAATTITKNFGVGNHTLIIPDDAVDVSIRVVGGAGGSGGSDSGSSGGSGGQGRIGKFSIPDGGRTLTINVGARGGNGASGGNANGGSGGSSSVSGGGNGGNSGGTGSSGSGGGGAGSTNQNSGHPQGSGANGGEGLDYNILDGSTAVAFAGGGAAGSYPSAQPTVEGGEGDEGGRSGGDPNGLGVANTGGGGGGTYTSTGKAGADGRVVVALSRTLVTNTSMTLISDIFTANDTPSTARIVLFAELPDGTSDFTVSATRDNTNFNNITLTDEGYAAGSSGTKIFTGSTPLTGAAPGQPQVQLRWKVVGSSLTGNNKIHGVALQWK